MGDLLEQGSAFLEDQRHRHMSRPVTYRRAADNVDVQATVGKTEFEQSDQNGLIQRIESRDYLIRTTDLVLAGQQTLPRAGDQVRETAGASTHVYEVMAPGNEPPFRYSDPFRRTLRIHTKHIATETA